MRRFGLLFVGLSVVLSASLIGQTAKPAEAYDVGNPTLIPVSVGAGTGTAVATGTAAVCVSTVVCGVAAVTAVAGGAALGYAGYRVLKVLGWAPGHAVEYESVQLPTTATTYGGGCWAQYVTGQDAAGNVTVYDSPNCTTSSTSTTWAKPMDGVSWVGNWGNGSCNGGYCDNKSWNFTFLSTGARTTSTAVTVQVSYAPGAPNNVAHEEYAKLWCQSGPAYEWDFGVAAFQHGGNDPRLQHTWDVNTCLTQGGISHIDIYQDQRTTSTTSEYVFKGAPRPYTTVAAPLHRWRSEVTCTDGSGSTVISGLSAQFRESDASLPDMPMPACPAIFPKPSKVRVYEGDADGVGGTLQLTWNAPSTAQTATVSDCLEGGSAYPCTLKLLKVTPSGNVDCATVDCESFDPATSTQDEYLCTWGTYTMPLSDCAPLAQTATATQTVVVTDTHDVTDPGEDVGEGTDTQSAPVPENAKSGRGCMGAINWNPVTWVLGPVKCALKWAFVPQALPYTSTWTSIQTKFPFTVLTQLDDLVDAVLGGVGVTGDGGGCASLNFTSAVPSQWRSSPDLLLVNMPTPAGSGCAGSGGWAGDLGGWRETFRWLLAGALWYSVLRALAGSVGPKGDPVGVDLS